MVVEGVNAMEGALELAQEKQVSIPVINFISNIIKKRISPTKMKGLVQLLKGTKEAEGARLVEAPESLDRSTRTGFTSML